MKKQKLLMLLALLGVIMTFGLSLQAKEVVYEPFDYDIGGLNGQGGTSDFGFDGVWTAQVRSEIDPGLVYGALPTIGNGLTNTKYYSNSYGGARAIDPAALAGLLGNGGTLWFSALMGAGPVNEDGQAIVVNSELTLALASDSFDEGNYNWTIQNAGEGIGVTLHAGKVAASTFNVDTAGRGGNMDENSTAPTYAAGQFGLVVGKITWGATVDTIEIYLPGEDLVLPETPVSTQTTDVDQSTFDTITFRWGDRVSLDEIRFSKYSWDVLGTGDPMKPSPEDGSTIMAANPLDLSWTNIPNDSNSVYVDVWFGTDPNEANPTYDMTKIVVAAMDVASVTVDASLEGTYYWQVNSYLDGDPAIITYNNDDPNDPNMIEGRLWSFTASYDTVPTLEMITPDQMTWSGGPVPLIAAVTNEGPSATIIEWVADADSSDDVVITGGDTATPTVTITKLPYSMAKIANAGFEADLLGEDGWGGAPGWTQLGRMGNWNPPADAYDGSAVPEGVMCAWAQTNDGGLAQVLTETLAADTDYSLTVEVGNSNRYDWTGYKVQLLAGGTVIAEDDNTLHPALGTFETSTVNYSYAPEDANKVGLPLEIRLLAGSQAPDYAECNFDDVQLTADPQFPVSTGVETVTMTVFVSDGANPTPVVASVEIDVYDDACAMARIAFGADISSDFDKDCDIDLDDLNLIAATWLNDLSIDAPAVSSDQEILPLVVNGGFQVYKAGTNLAVKAKWEPGNVYTGGIEGDVPVQGGLAICEDDTTTNLINCPGWIESAPGVGLFNRGVADSLDTGNTTVESFGAWGGGGNGTRIVSAESLGIINSGSVYTLSAQVRGAVSAGPIVLDLLADGVAVTPSSSVEPTGSDVFEDVIRTYNPADLAAYVGQSITVEVGTAAGNTIGGRASWDNVVLEAEIFDANEPLPTVDAGENMITWLGQPVSLTGTVDGTESSWDMEDVAYSWIASPSDDPKLDVVVSNPGDLNTTVTVTKVPYLVSYLLNGSFEQVTAQSAITSSRDSWGHYDRPAGSTAYALQYVPNTTYHFPEDENTPPDGNIICRTATAVGESRPDGLAMILDATYDPTATYELSVAVGHPHAVPDNAAYSDATWRGYLVQLVVGGTVESTGSGADNISGGVVVAEDDNSITIVKRTWETSVVTLDPSPELADLAGQPIQIRLLALDDEDPAYASQTKVFYDDVKLLINGETGAFVTDPGMSSVKMTLTVEEVSTGKVASVSTSIDVYDDACLASVASDPELDLDMGDLNADCITNLEDFADVAAAWLVDYSSTEPADQPEEE